MTYVFLTLKTLFALWILWCMLCWLAPLLLCWRRKPLRSGAISPNLRREIEANGIKLYECDTGVTDFGYAFSGFLWFSPAIVFSSPFLRYATIQPRDFVAAHELAHHRLNHVGLKLVCWMTLCVLSPNVRARLDYTEAEANWSAEGKTGYPASIVWGPHVVPSAAGRGQATEEELS